jgi:hypothetical protein
VAWELKTALLSWTPLVSARDTCSRGARAFALLPGAVLGLPCPLLALKRPGDLSGVLQRPRAVAEPSGDAFMEIRGALVHCHARLEGLFWRRVPVGERRADVLGVQRQQRQLAVGWQVGAAVVR